MQTDAHEDAATAELIRQAEQLPRCALRSELLSEPLAGTASTYRGWVLIEQPGPWGKTALLDSRLPDHVGKELERLADTLGLRILLIRRHGSSSTATTARQCYLAYTGLGPPIVEQCQLNEPEDVLRLDLAALARGESLGLAPVRHPLYFVCTHGKHDACCAERGRPVAAALTEVEPAGTWECSHMGGDRFAGNMLALPQGLYYGRLTPESAVRVAAAHRKGNLDLEALRGRCAYSFAAQAAEIFLRRDLGILGFDDLRIRKVQRQGKVSDVSFEVAGGRKYVVRVESRPKPAIHLSCDDAAPSNRDEHELVGLSLTPADDDS